MKFRDLDLLDTVEHAVFALEAGDDGAPRYCGFNRFACNVLGRPATEIVGMTARDLYPGRLGAIAFEHHVRAMRSGLPRSYEISLPIQGSARRVRTTLVPVKDAAGRVEMLIGSSTDLTGTEVSGMAVAPAAPDSDVEDFISLAAHDLRSPMRRAGQLVSYLREDLEDLDEDSADTLDLLQKVCDRSMRLIEDVLSHAQATTVVPEQAEFHFGDLIRDILALLDPAGRCGAAFPELRVRGDPAATQIILRNLIDNAIKHAAAKPGAAAGSREVPLQLDLMVEDTDHGHFSVSVRDNGSGFSEPALLFLAGGRLRTDSGFGLLGIRRLIRARQGALMATNAESGSGAVVSFTLPGSVMQEAPRAASA